MNGSILCGRIGVTHVYGDCARDGCFFRESWSRNAEDPAEANRTDWNHYRVFHMLMPFIGILLGQAISTQIGEYTVLAGGLLLFGIGAQMVFSAFNHEAPQLAQPAGIGLLFFALSVSLDSFSVGLSLGLSDVRTVVTLLMFGTASMILTWAGLIFGRKVHGFLGVYSEILGGSILCGFGLHVLFG